MFLIILSEPHEQGYRVIESDGYVIAVVGHPTRFCADLGLGSKHLTIALLC